MAEEDYARLMEIWARIVSKLNDAECKKRDYGTGYPLSPAEIHLLQAIGRNPGEKITDMAAHQGVTKGAISQMVNKLVAKKLVVKYSAAGNEKEVLLKLTKSGQTARRGHDRVHEGLIEQIHDEMGDLTEEQMQFLEKFLLSVEKITDEYNARME
jgi:DNA-binding MarR family transcriptional regulator